MSVRVGIEHNDNIYLGCDSHTTFGQMLYTDVSRPKIYKKNDMLIGAAGLVRTAQVIQMGYNAPKRLADEDAREYMFRWCTGLKKFLKKEEELATDGPYMNTVLLVGYNKVLYCIDPYFSFGTHKQYAVGSGAEVAIGSLATSKGTPRRRITKAVKAADANTIYVGGKILIESI